MKSRGNRLGVQCWPQQRAGQGVLPTVEGSGARSGADRQACVSYVEKGTGKMGFYRFIFKKTKQKVKKVLHFQPSLGVWVGREQAEADAQPLLEEAHLDPRSLL